MKKLFVFLTAALALTVLSCEKPDDDNVNDVDGKAKALTALDSKTSAWNTDNRVFNLAFSGEGVTLSTTLIGFDAELSAGKYALVSEGEAKIGDAVKEKTLLDGKAVSAGSISVGKSGTKYSFTATLTPAGGEELTLSWNGDIEWPADPAPKQNLSVVLSAQANKNEDGAVLSLTMNLATEGISSEFDWSTWQTVWKGEGGYLALDLYSEDGYLHDGIYKPCATAGTLLEGEFGIGWDPGDIYGIGMEFQDWGTCWWKVSGGAAVADHKILDGIVTVRQIEGGWQITWGKEYPTEYVFKGAIDALTKPEDNGEEPAGAALNISSGLTYTAEDKTAENFADDQNTPLSGVTLWRVTVNQGSAFVAAFDLLVAEGETDLAGEYTVASYPHEVGTAGNGVYMPDWGVQCGCYYTVGGKYFLINIGSTVKVSSNFDGTIKIEFKDEVLDSATWQSAGEGSLLLDNIAKAS